MNSLLRQWTGRFTQELQLAPAPFGLGHVPARLTPQTTVRSVCGFCSTGCSLDVHVRAGKATNLTPTWEYPVNLGMACPKGWEALTPLAAADRATTPLVRRPDGTFAAATWDEAMQRFVSGFKGVLSRHGPESVAFLSTGQICTEEMALLGALFKFGMGGVHGDSNTRQCMATAHVAYKQSFGFDAPPFSYADLEASDVLVFIGANPCIAHPILWQRVMRNRTPPEIIVVDPRRTETAMNATQHLALRPKTDLVLLYGLANLMIRCGWTNEAFITRHTSGWERFADFVRTFTPDRVADQTGLTVGAIYRCAETIARGRAVSFWWTMGVNQSHEATRTAQAIINLALMTGNIGRRGTGPNSITGQCNAMGSRLFANITSLPGGREFHDPQHRAEVATILGLPVDRIPTTCSAPYDEILERVGDGRIKALWVIATNLAHSWGHQRRLLERLRGLELLVVQDLYATTETARLAHLVLPAAGWGEKEGTFINSERRIGVVRNVARPPGQALSDFDIFRLVARHWGCADVFAEWSSPAAAFQILKRLSEGRPCDITGITDYAMIEACGGIQWPFPARADESEGGQTLRSAVGCEAPTAASEPFDDPAAGASHPAALPELQLGRAAERRLFADGRFFTPDGRARFCFDLPRPVAEPTDADFPFVLLTGRGSSAQWHTNTRTGKSPLLRTLYPAAAYVEIHPEDAGRLGIRSQRRVAIVSRRDRVECTAFVTPCVQPGHVFLPMHYAEANRLTQPEFDPHSRQPSYKHCPVRLEPLA